MYEKASLTDKFIVYGDNLAAQETLLPTHKLKVTIVVISPPYNTSSENWACNDRENSPMLRDWLGKVVDRDDLTRHEKKLVLANTKFIFEEMRSGCKRNAT